MSRIVFSLWDGGGNVPPMLALGSELQRRGHDVLAMGHPSQRQAVANAHLSFTEYVDAHPWSSAADFEAKSLMAVWCDAQLGAEVASQPADLFIVDHLLGGALKAVSESGARYHVFEHTLDSVVRTWRERKPLAEALLGNGIDRDLLLDGADRCIVPTSPHLESVTAANAVQTGPFASGAPSTPSEPTILLSLSTFNFPGITALLQQALDSVAGLPVHVIASTAGIVNADELTAPSNVELHPWLDHAEVMPRASLLFGHGGHSTAMLALAHDLPVVVMPAAPFTDQPHVGQAIERAGAGRVVDVTDDPGQIGEILSEVLANPSYRTVASDIGATIRELDGLTRAADLVESRL